MSESIIDAILKLKQKCRIEEEIGNAHGLTPRQMSCILALGDGETMSASELSFRLGLSPSRGSRVIGGLRKKGYLDLVRDEADKRYVMISLSGEGTACLKELEREKSLCEARLLEQLDADQAEEIARHLMTLVSVL